LTAPSFPGTVLLMSPSERLALSERVIAGWEAMGRPSGRVPDNMRIIGEENAALRKIVAADPSLKGRVDALAERYRVMALKIKLGLH
jgi:hypothetical protein